MCRHAVLVASGGIQHNTSDASGLETMSLGIFDRNTPWEHAGETMTEENCVSRASKSMDWQVASGNKKCQPVSPDIRENFSYISLLSGVTSSLGAVELSLGSLS